MRKMISVLLICLIPFVAHAEMSARELLSQIDTGASQAQRDTAIAYIRGFLDGYVSANSDTTDREQGYDSAACFDVRKMPLDGNEAALLPVLREYMRGHTDKLYINASAMLDYAFSATYPCGSDIKRHNKAKTAK